MYNIDTSQAYNNLKTVLENIRSLKIQGATNVALQGVQAFAQYINDVAKQFPIYEELINHLYEKIMEIKAVRITEPTLQNGLNYILHQIEKKGVDSALDASHQFKQLLSDSKDKVAEIGAEKIFDGSTIMTHCHSSFVTTTFWKARDKGKNFRVVNTETRPVYQGRKTALELLQKGGIEVIHIVDAGMWWAMKKFDVDLILIGADSITAEGGVLNKIGSRFLALASRELHVPLYICTTLLKYNPDTSLGRFSEIEMRGSEEVWPESPVGLKIYNPAFESIANHYISAYITEFGLIPPQLIAHTFETKYSADILSYKRIGE